MTFIFGIPLMLIAFWESVLENGNRSFIKDWFGPVADEEEDNPAVQDPIMDDEPSGKITITPFAELIKVFPNANLASVALVLLLSLVDILCSLQSILFCVKFRP